MVKFGICTSLNNAAAVRDAGWDFVEENIQGLFKGNAPDEQYVGQQAVAACPLPVVAANCLIPGIMKIVGPAVNFDALTRYMENVCRRAAAANCRTLVFGSGDARRVPEGWDFARATEQIVEFAKMAAPIAGRHGVLLVLEHLNTRECNIVLTPAEELAIVQKVNHPALECLIDLYHLWADDIPLSEVEPMVKRIRHVHLADKAGRVAPGESGMSDYRPAFAMLKKAGYNGALSVEALDFNDFAVAGRRVLSFLKKQWSEA